MSTTDHVVEPDLAGPDPDSEITLQLTLGQAEAVREWLFKATVNGATCLDEPLVNQVVSELGQLVDSIHATARVRRELGDAGLDVRHLSDQEVQALARRVSEAARPTITS